MRADQTVTVEEISVKEMDREEEGTLEGTTIKEEGEIIISHTMMTQIDLAH
jgi:ribosomal protein L24